MSAITKDFLDENLSKINYITTGRVYQAVINRERNLEYGGRCVEVVPDIPNEVISRIKKAAKKTKVDEAFASSSRYANARVADFILVENWRNSRGVSKPPLFGSSQNAETDKSQGCSFYFSFLFTHSRNDWRDEN